MVGFCGFVVLYFFCLILVWVWVFVDWLLFITLVVWVLIGLGVLCYLILWFCWFVLEVVFIVGFV